MGRKPNDSEPTRCASMILLLMGLFSCTVVYIFMSAVMKPTGNSAVERLAADDGEFGSGGGVGGVEGGGCCNGIESFELWGAAVKWGSDFKVKNSKECCEACKDMCTGNHGPCLCDTWVFCGDEKACGDKFGEVSLGISFVIFVILLFHDLRIFYPLWTSRVRFRGACCCSICSCKLLAV